MQKETMELIAPPRCTTARDDRRIVLMAVMDRSVASRTIAQTIKSVMHHFQESRMSIRRPLLRLPLIGNHRRFLRQLHDE
ncbi:hypothetical protein TNCV_3145281 [Trichonephila clavipes]|nr:hypothetical protein TNCV_3145281 [Trichonephila clavipes]